MTDVTRHKQCLSCGRTWKHAPEEPSGCKAGCGSLYVRWLNYEALAQDYRQTTPDGQAFGGT